MGLKSVGGRRAAAISVLFLLMLMLAPFVAHAQTDLEQAEDAKERAGRLVTAALANRNEVEAELVVTLERYQNLSFELSSVSASLDRLSGMIARTGIAMSSARRSADQRAVEAYMQALSMPGGVVWSSKSIEEAMVVGRTLAILAGEDVEEAVALEATKRDLLALDQEYQAESRTVESLVRQVQIEAARLQELFVLADMDVALAIGDAISADAAYRSALDEVEQARASEEERERQAERGTTTASTTMVLTPTTPVSTATTFPVPTTTTDPGAISRPIKPAVERWRSLVASYFSPALVDQALSIIQCESLGDPNAYNPYSGASGLFQFIPGTWAVASAKAGFGGESVFDPEANVASAAWLASYYWAAGRNPWTPWHCIP